MATLQQLDALSKAVPNINQRAAKQQQSALRIQARQAAGQAAPGQSSRQVAQAVAAPLAQAQGQVGLQAQQRSQQQLGQLQGQRQQAQAFAGQQGLQQQQLAQQAELGQSRRQQATQLAQQGREAQRELTQAEIAKAQRMQEFGIDQDNNILQLTLDQRADLQQLGQGLEDQLIDSRRRFTQDERGRKFTNLRQLADYTRISARDEQDLQNKLQEMSRAAKKKEMLMNAVYAKIEQTLQSESLLKQSRLGNQTRLEMAKAAAERKRNERRRQTDIASTGNIITGIVTVGALASGAGVPVALGAGMLAGGASQSQGARF